MPLDNLIDKIDIKVISLITSEERRSSVSRLLNDFNINFSFFDGYQVAKLDDKLLNHFKNEHLPFNGMTSSEFGCDLSHYYVIKEWFETKKTDYLLVLEDDAIFTGELYNFLNSNIHKKLYFDVLKIGGDKTKNKRTATRLIKINNFDIVYPYDPSFCAVAYIVNRNCAERLLRYLKIFFVQIDPRLFKYYPLGLSVLEASPFIVTQSGAPTTIEHIPEKNKKSILTRIKNDIIHTKRNIRWIYNFIKFYGIPRNFIKI